MFSDEKENREPEPRILLKKMNSNGENVMEKRILDMMFKNNPYGIIIFDAEGNFEQGNKVFFHEFDLPGIQKFTCFENPLFKAYFGENFLKKWKTGKTVSQIDNDATGTNDVKAAEVLLDSSPVGFSIKDGEGEPFKYVLTLEDGIRKSKAELDMNRMISALESRVSAEQSRKNEADLEIRKAKKRSAQLKKDNVDLKQVVKEAEERNEVLEEFSVRLVHKIKNSILTLKWLMDYSKADEHAASANIDKMLETSEEMIDFTGRLLDHARAGEYLGVKEYIRLKPLLVTLFDGLQKLDKSVRLEMAEPFPEVFADLDSMLELFSGLMENSFKYRDPAKDEMVIRVSGRQLEDGVEITFEDNGLGIREKNVPELFKTGYTTDSRQGFGFGLPIARKIIDAHNGKLEVIGTGGLGGAAFKIFMPSEFRKAEPSP